MNLIEFDTKKIEAIFLKAEEQLFNRQEIINIQYVNYDHTSFDANNQPLLQAVAGNPIIYCIWTGESVETLSPKYIGHAGRKISRQRLRSHLTKKNERTGAKLKNVIQELELKSIIGISKLIIDPHYMRKALEDWLIDRNSELLKWNQVGRNKLVITT